MPGTVSEVSATLVASTTRRARVRLENPLLLGRRQARVQRQDFGVLELGLAQHVGGVANLALTGQEHQHVTGLRRSLRSWSGDFVEGGEDRLIHRQVDPRRGCPLRPAPGSAGGTQVSTGKVRPDTSTIGASSKCLEKRSRSMVAEVMMTFRSGRRGSSGFQVAEQEVDVEAAFVGFVDDDRVVAFQIAGRSGFPPAGCRRSSA